MEEVASYIVIRIIALFAIALYFLPTLVAKRENRGRAFVVNLFLGWTFFGWVVAFIIGTQKSKMNYESNEEMRARIRKEELVRMEEREKLIKNKVN